MSEWALTSLGADEWRPSRLLSARSPWSGSSQLVRLGDVASVRSVVAPLQSPLPLVTPSNVHPSSGTVTIKRVVDDEGLVLGEDLNINDVLVPLHGPGPCVLVSGEVRGLAFRGFLIVRAFDEHADPVWLWAVLTSTSGVAAREALSASSTVSTIKASLLADLAVPVPTLEQSQQPTFSALVPRPLVVETAGEESRSTWSLRDLRGAATWTAGAVAHDEEDGLPMSELGSTWSGSVDKRKWFAVPAPDRLEVLTHRRVRGHREPFRLWATGGKATTDGTVVFTRTEPFRVLHAPAGFLLSKELLALDIDARRGLLATAPANVLQQMSAAGLATVLALYFSSPRGNSVLASAASGVVIRRLSLAALGAVRVPHELRPPAVDLPIVPLAERLESALRRALAL